VKGLRKSVNTRFSYEVIWNLVYSFRVCVTLQCNLHLLHVALARCRSR